MTTLHEAYMQGYNGEPNNYSWSSQMSDSHFIGQCCKQAGFTTAEKIAKSRGSSYRLNGSKNPITIEYNDKEMSCDIDTVYGRGHYEYA